MEFSDSFPTQIISSNYSNFILSLGIVQILGALVDIPILVSLLIIFSTFSLHRVTNLQINDFTNLRNNQIYRPVIGQICEWYSDLNSLRILQPSAERIPTRKVQKWKNPKPFSFSSRNSSRSRWL